ncbi:MAG: hypothetical protein OEM62_03360 [Acidobacteriota bacterium]|nr:hypothetical protein [Acidobacteriota bacterium]
MAKKSHIVDEFIKRKREAEIPRKTDRSLPWYSESQAQTFAARLGEPSWDGSSTASVIDPLAT